jgi:hypothetical protein
MFKLGHVKTLSMSRIYYTDDYPLCKSTSLIILTPLKQPYKTAAMKTFKKILKYFAISLGSVIGLFIIIGIIMAATSHDVKFKNTAEQKAYYDSTNKAEAYQHEVELKQKTKEDSLAAITKAEEDSVNVVKERAERLQRNFDPWDGSHINLVKYLKENLNDPDSYEHVDTRYWDVSDSDIVVLMKYRAKNAFGGKILGAIKARTDINGNILKILDY